MVISLNPIPSKEEFQLLLNNTIETLERESKKHNEEYLKHIGAKLENIVAEAMSDNAMGTPFEKSIELISGHRFPDIIAKNYYGVEVKSTIMNKWKTTGNSVLEGTRVNGIERIYMLFGKMIAPIEFKYRPYEDCLADVVVTHSPRYAIDMELPIGSTIFDKLKIPYDTLRESPTPIKQIFDYYRNLAKPGEEVWYLDQYEPKSTSMIIKPWNKLSIPERREYWLKAMVTFPEIFSKRTNKFNRLAIWLVNREGIVCPNVRDIFSAGGQGTIEWNGKHYTGIPMIIVKMSNSLTEIKSILNEIEKEELENYWNMTFDNSIIAWINLMDDNTKKLRLPLNIKEYLIDKLLARPGIRT